jgi:DNA-binding transcriptional ArsR family regulator
MAYSTGAAEALDALGDPTRRRVLELLRDGPRAVGEVAADLPVSRPAVSQHLRVLKGAGLVSERRDGTRHLYRIDPAGLAALRTYLESFWDDALASFRTVAEREGSRPERTRPDEGDGDRTEHDDRTDEEER